MKGTENKWLNMIGSGKGGINVVTKKAAYKIKMQELTTWNSYR